MQEERAAGRREVKRDGERNQTHRETQGRERHRDRTHRVTGVETDTYAGSERDRARVQGMKKDKNQVTQRQ